MANEAAKRLANAALRSGDVWAEKDRWLPCVREAMRRLSTQGVDRPAGLSADGELALNHYMVSATGLVKWTLRYGWRNGRDGEWLVIGGFVTDYLPEDTQRRCATKPVQTHGRTVVINQKVRGELARPVKVLVDATGMPVPIDPAIWAAMALDG